MAYAEFDSRVCGFSIEVNRMESADHDRSFLVVVRIVRGSD